ncbi:MAG TPA: hypothetical protein GX734_04265 [Clostridiaceae bacterium]|nr:hypothetical protein [Clostridiaceae bacterium]
MNQNKKLKMMKIALSFLIAIAICSVGCSPKTQITPTAKEISKISTAAGFLAARTEESGGFIASEDKRDRASAYAYLYDNAIAAIALSYAGAQQHAEKIADAIVFAQGHDRTFQDGRLRNAYNSGDPKSDSGRSIAAGKVTIRLPGFWKDGHWQEDAHTVSTSTGNMAWAILGLSIVAKNALDTQRQEYLTAAMRAADFVLGLKSDSGGFTAGYEGWDDSQINATYKSTEHNISLVCAFSTLAELVREIDSDKAALYADAADHAKDFVLSMYDDKIHCFYTGTMTDGITISKGIIPLDANSLTVIILGEELDDRYQTIDFVEKKMAVGDGFDFSAGDLDGIWNEGTAQMAVCYRLLENTEKYESTMAYLKTQTAKDGSIPAADRDGVSTGFAIIGSDILWEYNNVQSISATAWLAFAQLDNNHFMRASE